MDGTAIATIGHNSLIPVYREFVDQLDALRKLNSEAAFDYETSKGNKNARSHVYKLRQTKAAVEKARKEEKAESLAYGRRVDEQAKTIMGEIDTMIEVHTKPLEAIEQRETDRIDRHEAGLAEIVETSRQATEQWQEMPLDDLKASLDAIQALTITEGRWEEFTTRAAEAKDAAISAIRDAINKREQCDAEQAELARLRREEEARKQAERDEEIRREAEKRAAAEAERKAKEERERAEAEARKEREAAERRELELRLEKERAEREKAEAEQRAAQAAQEAEERVRREAEEKAKREAEEAAKREADKKHRAAINREAVAAFVNGGLTEDEAKTAVTLIAQKTIPRVTISY